MYCPKCRKQNHDDALTCDSCGEVLRDVARGTTPSQTSHMAISSIVLACFILFITSIFAITASVAFILMIVLVLIVPVSIILGIIALVLIGRSDGRLKGKTMAISGICVSSVALLIVSSLTMQRIVVNNLKKVKVTTTKINLRLLHKAVNQFKMDTGRYPTEDEGLFALVEEPYGVHNWQPGGYLGTTVVPTDGWGNHFIYHLLPEAGKAFGIISLGADGLEGGEGYGSDLRSTDTDLWTNDPKYRMAIVETALDRFYLDCGRMPIESEGGLEVLLAAPRDLEGKWNGPYLKRSELLDRWGNPYIYVSEGQRNPGYFDLISYGADGKKGGNGYNADIIND